MIGLQYMTRKTGFCTASMTRRTKIVILSYSAAQRACSVRSAAMYTFTNHVRRVIEAVQNPVFRVIYFKKVVRCYGVNCVFNISRVTHCIL